MREWEDEVFIEEDPSDDPDDPKPHRSLVVIDKPSGNMFALEVKDYVGKITNKRRAKLKSIGIFSVHD